MINIGIGIGWAKAIYSVANNIIANFKARVATYPNSIFEAGPCLDTTLEELNAIGLLDNASLVITPNAYNEGKLYDVVPNTTLGDMDVVRATTATRVNSAGLIEVVPKNLYQYSNDFTNGIWNKFNVNITTSQVGYDGSNNASLLVEDSTANAHLIINTPILLGQTTISVYAKENTRNWLYIRGVQSGVPVFGWFNLSNGTLGTIQTNGVGNITSVGNGWYRCSLTIANFDTGFETYIGISNANNTVSYLGNGSSIFIQNSQVEQGSTATTYFPTTTRLNIPRIDYTNGTCPSLLVEPQRTNSLLNSQTLAASYTFNQCSITSSQISPDGSFNAKRITNAAVVPDPYFEQSISFSPNTYTWSIYVKQGTALTAIIKPVHVGIGGDVSFVTFTFATETITKSAIVTTAGFDKLTNGWYRIYCSVNVTAAVSSLRGRFGNPSVANVYNDWAFPQLEVGSYPTSYIPTVASTVTRNADVISKTGISSLIDSQQGVLFADLQFFTEIGNIRSIHISNGNNNNRIGFFGHPSIANRITFAISSGGVITDINFNGVTLTNRNKVLIRYSGTTFTAFVNGVKSTNQTFTPFAANFLNRIGLDYGEDILRYEGRINSIQLYKTALTDAECIALTTL